jgi:hypothetical protein
MVLYFFCISTLKEKSPVSTFIHTLLCQLVDDLSPEKQKPCVITFLTTLLESILRRETSEKWSSYLTKKDKRKTIIEQILATVPNDQLWDALKAAVDTEQGRKLIIIIDGFDMIEQRELRFFQEISALVVYLLERPMKPKILLTSKRQADDKYDLNGLLCIEYNKERSGFLPSSSVAVNY